MTNAWVTFIIHKCIHNKQCIVINLYLEKITRIFVYKTSLETVDHSLADTTGVMTGKMIKSLSSLHDTYHVVLNFLVVLFYAK